MDIYWGLGVSLHGPATQGKTVPRILVADDNTNIQKMVVLAFQERGIEVITVGNGEAAVRRIPDANPDLILADVFMPVRNGYEVCEFVKKDTRYSHIPVILLVGAFDPLDEKEARRVGADGVLKKPFVPPDPLIAMVMSALEKNPKVVAELAKAKEAKEIAAAVTALPAAAMENPAMAEVKPLPEFPEPSPEEAAMIYGFGKGVRAIDADETEEEEESRTTKAKSSETLKDPQESQKKSKTPAVAAPKTPVVAMEEEDEESFDSSATASDWRRNAADFEVPDNVEANPIYSYGKNFEPITFPSERDVPPKHVRSNEEANAIAAAETVASAAPAESAPVISEAATNWELTAEHEIDARGTEVSAIDETSPLTASVSSEIAETLAIDSNGGGSSAEVIEPVLAVTHASEPETVVAAVESSSDATAQEAQKASRPGFVARVRGWMDMMSPSTDEQPETSAENRDEHWMTSLASPTAAKETTEIEKAEISAPLQVSKIEDPVRLAEAESLAENAAPPAVAEHFASEPVVEEIHAEATQQESFEPVVSSADSYQESDRVSGSDVSLPSYGSDAISSGDKYGEAEPIAQESAPSQETAHEIVHLAAAENELPQVSVETHAEEVHQAVSEKWSDLLSVPSDERRNGEETAEHLPLEPIISELHEQPVAAASASNAEQEPSHVAEWLKHKANLTNEHAEETEAAGTSAPEATGYTWPQDQLSEELNEKPFADQPEHSMFGGGSRSHFAENFAERIPTLPPPNREALSQIPFLMPESEREPATPDNTTASNSAALDEVVRRVLEKLQPQLHELLSQGVKPLVENMLQNELRSELHKNEK